MPKSKRAKKKKTEDFKKVKLKPGRTLKKGTDTDVSFKVGKVVLLEQLRSQTTASAAPVTHRKLSLDDLIGQLSHYSPSVRKDALDGVRELLSSADGRLAVQTTLSRLLQSLLPQMNHEDRSVRHALRLVLSVMFSHLSVAILRTYAALFTAHITCALSNISREIRMDMLRSLAEWFRIESFQQAVSDQKTLINALQDGLDSKNAQLNSADLSRYLFLLSLDYLIVQETDLNTGNSEAKAMYTKAPHAIPIFHVEDEEEECSESSTHDRLVDQLLLIWDEVTTVSEDDFSAESSGRSKEYTSSQLNMLAVILRLLISIASKNSAKLLFEQRKLDNIVAVFPCFEARRKQDKKQAAAIHEPVFLENVASKQQYVNLILLNLLLRIDASNMHHQHVMYAVDRLDNPRMSLHAIQVLDLYLQKKDVDEREAKLIVSRLVNLLLKLPIGSSAYEPCAALVIKRSKSLYTDDLARLLVHVFRNDSVDFIRAIVLNRPDNVVEDALRHQIFGFAFADIPVDSPIFSVVLRQLIPLEKEELTHLLNSTDMLRSPLLELLCCSYREVIIPTGLSDEQLRALLSFFTSLFVRAPQLTAEPVAGAAALINISPLTNDDTVEDVAGFIDSVESFRRLAESLSIGHYNRNNLFSATVRNISRTVISRLRQPVDFLTAAKLTFLYLSADHGGPSMSSMLTFNHLLLSFRLQLQRWHELSTFVEAAQWMNEFDRRLSPVLAPHLIEALGNLEKSVDESLRTSMGIVREKFEFVICMM